MLTQAQPSLLTTGFGINLTPGAGELDNVVEGISITTKVDQRQHNRFPGSERGSNETPVWELGMNNFCTGPWRYISG